MNTDHQSLSNVLNKEVHVLGNGIFAVQIGEPYLLLSFCQTFFGINWVKIIVDNSRLNVVGVELVGLRLFLTA
jgi:hypothetical protein